MPSIPPVNFQKIDLSPLPIRKVAKGITYKEESSNSEIEDASDGDIYIPSSKNTQTKAISQNVASDSDEDPIPMGKRRWVYSNVSSAGESDDESTQTAGKKRAYPNPSSARASDSKRPRKSTFPDSSQSRKSESPPVFIKQENPFQSRQHLGTYQIDDMSQGMSLITKIKMRAVAILQDNEEFQFSEQLVPGKSYIFRNNVKAYNPQAYRFSPWRDPNNLEHSLSEVASVQEPWMLSQDLQVKSIAPISGTDWNLNVINKKDTQKNEKFIQARKNHYAALIDRSISSPTTYTVKKIPKNSQLPHEKEKEGGYGLFAKKDIRQGEFITNYTACIVAPDSPAEEELRHKIGDYAFNSTKRLVKWLDPDTKQWQEALFIGAHTGGAGHTANTAIKVTEGLNPQVDVDKNRCNASYEDFLVTFTKKSDPKAKPIRMVDLTIVASKDIKKDEEILVEYPYEFIEWMNKNTQPKVKVKKEEDAEYSDMMHLSSAHSSAAASPKPVDYASPDSADEFEDTPDRKSKSPWYKITLPQSIKTGLSRKQRACKTQVKRESAALAYRWHYDRDHYNSFQLSPDKQALTGRPKTLAIQHARIKSAIAWFHKQDLSILDHPPPEEPPNAWTTIQLTDPEKKGLDPTGKSNTLRAKRLKIADDTMAGHDWEAYQDMLLRTKKTNLKSDAKQAHINTALREWMEAQEPDILNMPIPARPQKELTALDVVKKSKIPDGQRKDTYIGRLAAARMEFHDDSEYQRVRKEGIKKKLTGGSLTSYMHTMTKKWLDRQDPSILDIPIPEKPPSAWDVIPIPHEKLTSTYINAKYEYKYEYAQKKMAQDPNANYDRVCQKGEEQGLKNQKLKQYINQKAMEWMKNQPASLISTDQSETYTV